jgi:hypothetical protein
MWATRDRRGGRGRRSGTLTDIILTYRSSVRAGRSCGNVHVALDNVSLRAWLRLRQHRLDRAAATRMVPSFRNRVVDPPHRLCCRWAEEFRGSVPQIIG